MEQFAYLCERMNRIEEANGKTLLTSCLPMGRVWETVPLINTVHSLSLSPVQEAENLSGKHLNVSAKSGLVKKVDGTYKTPDGGVPFSKSLGRLRQMPWV